jgi:diaminopimelate epimerase
MQGAGNDFVVLDGVTEAITMTPDVARRLADRRFGIGADQILLVEAAGQPDIDFRYRIFNADGGEVEQCGNGARCFVRFVLQRGLTSKRKIRVATLGGVIEPELLDDGLVRVDMGAPALSPAAVHFDTQDLGHERMDRATVWQLPCPLGTALEGLGAVRVMPANSAGQLGVTVVSMGNPHAVTLVQSLSQAGAIEQIGPWLENHPRFLQRVNAGFLQVLSRQSAALRVWERGAGETLACGTGACAAAVAGIQLGLLDSPVTLQLRGGHLHIDWNGRSDPGAHVWMSGPAQTVFEGQIELP